MKVLILCFSDYFSEPRVLRTIHALEGKYELHVFSTGTQQMANIHFQNIKNYITEPIIPSFHVKWPSVLRKPVSLWIKLFIEKRFSKDQYYKNKYWTKPKRALLKKIEHLSPDLIIGHGIYTLPLLAKGPATSKKIFNAHEYYLKEFENNVNWLKYSKPYYEYLIKSSYTKIDLMFCVSGIIQAEYQKDYPIRSIVITNATNYVQLVPKNSSKPIKIIHHGAAISSRQVELMADMMNYLSNDYELYLMLIPTEQEYLNALKEKYRSNSRIKFVTPVKVNEIAVACNKYDIGLFILPPVNFNWLNALPNKLFEFVQGRLCIAVSPNPDMKNLVEKYDLGVVSPDFTSLGMADTIKKLSCDEINNYKNNSNKCAKELSGEINQEIMCKEIEKLLQN